jgi:hypothetical protein
MTASFCQHFEFAIFFIFVSAVLVFLKSFSIVHEGIAHRGLGVMSLFNIVHFEMMGFNN